MTRGNGHDVRVRGRVQGVGFRPFVWRLAHDMGGTGHVRNDGEGVFIHVEGIDIAGFLLRLRAEAPPLSEIASIELVASGKSEGCKTFDIVESHATDGNTFISPDIATCPDCLAETLDARERRFNYPFTNCTNCGPRLSIIRTLPYDRGNTSMSGFPMCEDCAKQYLNPADRRFHAQPIACPTCGPQVWLETSEGRLGGADAINETTRRIEAGEIVAIKGLGGFHLACDGQNAAAVDALRRRKRRNRKPFALMALDVDSIRSHAKVNAEEALLLASTAAPIVLLKKRADSSIAISVAPGQAQLGFMLPYTPLHHLLMRKLRRPIVLTSGNLSDEPQVTGNEEARHHLFQQADVILMNNRDIAQRVDDSVVRNSSLGPLFLRRARGYAPAALQLHPSFSHTPGILAMGADLKGTIALKDGQTVHVSQHLGDLATARSRAAYEETVELFSKLYKVAPGVIASDLHPDFHGTTRARVLAEQWGARHEMVQHHHAHIASCMAENDWPLGQDEVLGIALDGVGLGSDGTLWGGEFLKCGYRGFERVGHFDRIPLAGGDASAREPWRCLHAYLAHYFREEVAELEAGQVALRSLQNHNVKGLDMMLRSPKLAVKSSSAGRLFDAVAALLGICVDVQAYEGEAASLLEGLAASEETNEAYDSEIDGGEIRWGRMFQQMLADLTVGRHAGLVARKFHNTLVAAVIDMALRLAGRHGLNSVALSGGVFVNCLVIEGINVGLTKAGLRVLHQRQMPHGDGGIALGQVAVAAARHAV